MNLREWTWLLLGCLVAGLTVTGVVVIAGTPSLGEDALAREVQRAGWFEPIAIRVRWLTTTEVVLLLGVALAAALLIGGERRRAICLAAMLLALPAAQMGLKEIVDRERPSPAYVDVRDSWTSPSYPSGHVMSGTMLWGYVAITRSPRWLRRSLWRSVQVLAATLVILGPAASVYLGVHWPTDTIGGLSLGAALAIGALVLERMTATRPLLPWR